MERTHKSWGEKWNLFQNDLCEVSILYLQPNQRCSWHKHTAKKNQFFVIEGTLFVKTASGVAEVGKNQIFTTNPGEYHEFQTHDSPATIQEIMYVKYDAEDIQRETIGGPLVKEEIPFGHIKSFCSGCGRYFYQIPDQDAVWCFCETCRLVIKG